LVQEVSIHTDSQRKDVAGAGASIQNIYLGTLTHKKPSADSCSNNDSNEDGVASNHLIDGTSNAIDKLSSRCHERLIRNVEADRNEILDISKATYASPNPALTMRQKCTVPIPQQVVTSCLEGHSCSCHGAHGGQLFYNNTALVEK
jgi:hypothetical protein